MPFQKKQERIIVIAAALSVLTIVLVIANILSPAKTNFHSIQQHKAAINDIMTIHEKNDGKVIASDTYTRVISQEAKKYVMLDLITWNNTHSFERLRYETLTEISIFHLIPLADGSFEYDGDGIQLPRIINTAHAHGVRVTVAWGGGGVPIDVIDGVLSNAHQREITIDNLVREVKNNDYDGIQVDLEDFPRTNTISGDSNRELFSQFIIELHNRLKQADLTYTLSIAIPSEDEENVFDLSLLQKYVNYILVMNYDYPATGQSISESMSTYASTLNDRRQLILGLSLVTPPYETPQSISKRIEFLNKAGYGGVFFWESEAFSSRGDPLWTVIEDNLHVFRAFTN